MRARALSRATATGLIVEMVLALVLSLAVVWVCVVWGREAGFLRARASLHACVRVRACAQACARSQLNSAVRGGLLVSARERKGEAAVLAPMAPRAREHCPVALAVLPLKIVG